MDHAEITLPGGLFLEGAWQRTAHVRALAGEDEELLRGEGQQLSPCARVTAVLARCVTRLGPLSPVPVEGVQSLTVGDREALMLHLRRLTLGDRLSCVLTCPAPSCGAKMDLDLQVSDLLLPPYPHQSTWHERRFTDQGQTYHLRFRLPTGGDQEAVALFAAGDLPAAVSVLLARCIQEAIREGAGEEPVVALPEAIRDGLSDAMAALDPQAEIALQTQCAECGRPFTALFDAGQFCCQELLGRGREARELYEEVHYLALHYHWSEAEILAMTRRKRHLYLDLLADASVGVGVR